MNTLYSAADVIKDNSCGITDKVWVKATDVKIDQTQLSKRAKQFLWDYNFIAAFVLVVLTGIRYGIIELSF